MSTEWSRDEDPALIIDSMRVAHYRAGCPDLAIPAVFHLKLSACGRHGFVICAWCDPNV